MSEALNVNTTLTALDLEGVQQDKTNHEREINSNNNQAGSMITAGGASALCEALKVNTTLAELNLGCPQKTEKQLRIMEWCQQQLTNTVNCIGAKGARALSEALKVNTTLTKLNLGCVQQQEKHRKEHSIDIEGKNRQQFPCRRNSCTGRCVQIQHSTEDIEPEMCEKIRPRVVAIKQFFFKK